ncbi:MAG: serine protease [Rhizonema sp. NSF051]|nr:serine protease [Rhizonema sp. NSF051]
MEIVQMNWRSLRQGIIPMLFLVACVGGISLALVRQLPIFVNCTNLGCNNSPLPLASTQLSVEQLQQVAEAITVKVLSKETLGSGTLVKREGQIYTVITNAHVLRAANPPYQIQTTDGHIHQAIVSKAVHFQSNDLGLLQFRNTGAVYAIANLGDSSTLVVGDKVFVGGFTHLIPNPSLQAQKEAAGEFIFTVGQVSLVLNKALEGGYQIGYTNEIRKGMSGAPLLNLRGEVVGINGQHKDPVWDAPELYQDGSEPSKQVQNLITRSSLAVPIKTVVQLAPKFVTPKKLVFRFGVSKAYDKDRL